MKNKLFAPFLTLFAVALTLFVMLFGGEYKLKEILIVLLIVLIVFYIAGLAIQSRVNKFIEANEEQLRLEAEEEGAVIEKDAVASEESKEEDNVEEYSLPPLTGAMPQRPGEANGFADFPEQ